MQSMMEQAQPTQNSNFKLELNLASLVGFIPVYGFKDATKIKQEKGFGSNYLIEVDEKPAWVLNSGPLRFHNSDEGYQKFDKLDGHTSLFVWVKPAAKFAINQ